MILIQKTLPRKRAAVKFLDTHKRPQKGPNSSWVSRIYPARISVGELRASVPGVDVGNFAARYRRHRLAEVPDSLRHLIAAGLPA
jgi:hypothetical protein